MNAKAETQENRYDSAKLTLATLILILAIGGFYYYADASVLLRVLGLLAAIGVAVAVVLQTAIGRQTWSFFQDARTEVRKVVWPTRQETVQTTLIVVVMVFIMGLLIWLFDLFLNWAVRLFTGQG